MGRSPEQGSLGKGARKLKSLHKTNGGSSPPPGLSLALALHLLIAPLFIYSAAVRSRNPVESQAGGHTRATHGGPSGSGPQRPAPELRAFHIYEASRAGRPFVLLSDGRAPGAPTTTAGNSHLEA